MTLSSSTSGKSRSVCARRCCATYAAIENEPFVREKVGSAVRPWAAGLPPGTALSSRILAAAWPSATPSAPAPARASLSAGGGRTASTWARRKRAVVSCCVRMARLGAGGVVGERGVTPPPACGRGTEDGTSRHSIRHVAAAGTFSTFRVTAFLPLVLRAAESRCGPGRAASAFRALITAGVADQIVVKSALSATVISRRDDAGGTRQTFGLSWPAIRI